MAEPAGDWLDLRVQVDIQNGDCNAALSWADELAQFEAAAKGTEEPGGPDRMRARILAACGRMAEAVQLQESIVAGYPEEASARIQYSVYLERMGRVDESIAALEALVELYPDGSIIKNNLAYTLIEADRDPNRARDLLAQSLRADPESAPTLDSWGWFYYKMGQFEAALEYIYQAGVGLAGLDPEILDHLGDTTYRVERYEDARWYWQRALELLERQAKSERYLAGKRDKVAEKLRQMDSGGTVEVAELFSTKE